MITKGRICISIDATTVAAIDEMRGDIPRSRVLENMIDDAMYRTVNKYKGD